MLIQPIYGQLLKEQYSNWNDRNLTRQNHSCNCVKGAPLFKSETVLMRHTWEWNAFLIGAKNNNKKIISLLNYILDIVFFLDNLQWDFGKRRINIKQCWVLNGTKPNNNKMSCMQLQWAAIHNMWWHIRPFTKVRQCCVLHWMFPVDPLLTLVGALYIKKVVSPTTVLQSSPHIKSTHHVWGSYL